MTRRSFTTPRDADLGLAIVSSASGLSISALPNGSLFAIAYRDERGRTLINQVLGQPAFGGIGRIYLRIGGDEPRIVEIVGPGAKVRFGASSAAMRWEGQAGAIRHRVTLSLHASEPAWFWRIALASDAEVATPCDILVIQDVGLGDRGFVMGSEAYVSQYVDHHIADHPSFGPVIMSRQAQPQGGRYPFVAQGLMERAAAYATDALQLLGPTFRVTGQIGLDFGQDLPGERLQHEVACPMLQSGTLYVASGSPCAVTAFGLFVADHPAASSLADLDRLAPLVDAKPASDASIALAEPPRSLLQDAPLLDALPADEALLAGFGARRDQEERRDGELLSFFVPDGAQNRHIVLAAKEARLPRRHGAMLRSGQSMMLDDSTLCATLWMHGVFAAQLTIGNTSFHKLFSVSRDPYNITRASGLRILVDTGQGWRLLGVPTIFDIGLADARWIYRLADRTITIHAIADGNAPAMLWRVSVEGPACRFLVLGHIVLGEREFEDVGRIEIDDGEKRISFRPGRESLWGRTYPDAVYHLVTATPDAIEAIGGDELLYADGAGHGGPYVALRSRPSISVSFAIVGSMTDRAEGLRLAERYAAGVSDDDLLAPARRYWSHVTRDTRLRGGDADLAAHDAFLPWLAHDAMIHLTVPHGLEQYTGAAWGTRDVCQGPVEYLLTMEHDDTVREILRVVFSEQNESKGDWPQWFMLEPYAQVRAGGSHGDVIIWPLKALCDYVEATNDFAFLDEPLPWRANDDLARTTARASVAAHVDTLLDTVRSRFIPGTSLIRYGEGDWNDSLQPVDPDWPDWMVSSWTVALLYEQLERWANILDRREDRERASDLRTLAEAMRADFNRILVKDGIVAGYGLFAREGNGVELLLHPSDEHTGIRYSLIPMTQAIIGGLFTPDQTERHLDLIAAHLVFPDGARLMDKPVPYHGGTERLFRRAESAAYFGREIGLMYVHAHLRYCEALAATGDAEGVWRALALVNPITVTQHLPHASLRQRNTYFSSSDAAFRDRYQASDQWDRVASGKIAVDGGWRIYSSGPGLYVNVLLRHAFGRRRHYGERIASPTLPDGLADATIETGSSA